mgnify:CR=1 FL=1
MSKKKLHKPIPFHFRLKYGYYQFFDHFIGRVRFFKWTKKSRTRFYKKLEDYLKKTGPGKAIPVDRHKDISYNDFMNNYVKKGIPVILEGAAKEWSCVKNWSLDYFKDLHGDDEIVYMDQRDIANGYSETTLRQIIEDMQSGKENYYRFYPLLLKHPEHIQDFDYKWMRKRKYPRGFGEAFHVFLSAKGGFTPLHNASSQNLFIQVHGEKNWKLYPLEYACVVDPPPARNMYRSAPIIRGKDFDPFKCNYEDYPLYEYIDHHPIHLKAGDVFYNPPYMWHSVMNPTDESIGVGYRYFTPFKSWRISPLYFFLEMMAFNPPMWKSWKNYGDINLIHLMETGNFKEVSKKKGVKKMKSSVN